MRSGDEAIWGSDDDQFVRVARNVFTRYLVIIVDLILGFFVLPFNVRHLGTTTYGLWMLAASVSFYFSVLDLGFGGSVTKFVAEYRARRDVQGLNEIASTLFVAFTVIGAVAYLLFIGIALNMERVFSLTPEQIPTARWLVLVIGLYVSATFPASVFGGILNGFQRYDLNSFVGIGSTIVIAAVNVGMLLMGFTLVQMVIGTTTVRLATYVLFRWNAYSVFPALRIRPSLFRWARVREVTAFSVYMSILDWAQKLNYSADAIVIGAFMSSGAVAIWTVPQRLAEALQGFTNQMNSVLFPFVVDSDAANKNERLRTVLIQGTRMSVLAVAPLATAMFLLAGPLVRAWVGPKFSAAIHITEILAIVTAIRVGNSSATTVLKGAGRHRFLAFTNLGMAIVNVALSLLWIRPYGLMGQAMGTFVPVAFGSMFILWPAACRRVGVGVASAFWQAVWPPLWPVAVMALVIMPLRELLPDRMFAIGLAGAFGTLCYLASFLAFAVKRDERRLYIAKATEFARSSLRLPAVA
jgi:O-antigen/teichoic acid export membrane protein